MTFRMVLGIMLVAYAAYKVMQTPVWVISSDSKRCPFCYGNDLCKDIDDDKITLRFKSPRDFFYNLISVKNVYFAEYNREKVVLKRLGSKSELEKITGSTAIVKDVILDFIDGVNSDSVTSFKPCSREVASIFVQRASSRFGFEQIWTIVQINVEPLMLSLLQDDDWPVPKLYGACGFLIVEKYCGLPLNYFEAFDWHTRAYLALQLLEAAIDFTFKHDDFRVYLTDISPDNIAVDDNFTLYFVDLENVIMKQKLEDNRTVHYSEFFDDEDFVYSEEEVCQSSISDHNVYAVCRLLLSQRAPWPMMPDGLLHSPPPGVVALHKELFGLVEECVDSAEKLDRFYIAEELIRMLKQAIEGDGNRRFLRGSRNQ